MLTLKVSEQCRIAASKGNQVRGMIRRNITYKEKSLIVGETGASCYRGRLLQGHFMQNYIDAKSPTVVLY